MKKLSAILFIIISVNVYSYEGITVINKEHVRTPGVLSVPPVTYEVRMLSEAELQEKNQTLNIDTLYAKTANATGTVNTATKVWTSQSTCFK